MAYRTRGLLVVSVVCHAVASLPVQALTRRLGLPYQTPRGAPAVVATTHSLAMTMIASAAGLALARALTGTTSGVGPDAARSVRPLRLAALGPLPVIGPILTVVAEVATAARLAANSGVARRESVLWRFVAAMAGLVGMRLLAYHGLAAELAARTPAAPGPPPPLTQLNVHPVPVGGGTSGTGSGPAGPDGFVLYFDGVGRVIPRTTPAGRRFAQAMASRLPGWTIVMSMMPNDVTQRPAWQRPVTGRMWRRLMRRDQAWLIGRGVWEAVVALDPRYRDRLSSDNTTTVLAHLAAAGYRGGSGTPVVFVGLSAGAQTGLRCASDVARALGAPLDVVCLGGFCDGTADLSAVRRVHAAVSWGDPAEMAPVLFFPARWTAFGVGAWSRARRRRVVVIHRHDWATHVGHTGYLGDAVTGDGRSRLDQAADLVTRAARELSDTSRGRRTAGLTGGAA